MGISAKLLEQIHYNYRTLHNTCISDYKKDELFLAELRKFIKTDFLSSIFPKEKRKWGFIELKKKKKKLFKIE